MVPVLPPLSDLRAPPGLLLRRRLPVHHVGEEPLPEDLLRGEQLGQLGHHRGGQVLPEAEVGLAQDGVQQVAVLWWGGRGGTGGR